MKAFDVENGGALRFLSLKEQSIESWLKKERRISIKLWGSLSATKRLVLSAHVFWSLILLFYSGEKKNVSLFPLDFTQYLVTVGNDCSKQVLQIYIYRRGKRKFNPRKYGFHIMNHGIARVMDLSIRLHVRSKSGGGGGELSKSFPSYSLFCGLFQTPS